MADPKQIDTLSSELENRLDALFGENDIQLPNVTENEPHEHYPLAELKNLILSIDWEITDEVLDNLLLQLRDLQLTYEHDKIVTMFLQILKSLGSYIRTHRAKAHPKTFKILNSVFVSLDKVVLSREMTERAKKKMLRAEMNRYKELRAQIARSKTAAAKRKPQPTETQPIEIKNKKEDPVIGRKEPAAALDLEAKEHAPVTIPDEPSVVSELKDKDKEPVLTLAEPSEPPVVGEKEGPADIQPESKRDLAAATLADAVEEIKQYIHAEISALKKEIQLLREQQ